MKDTTAIGDWKAGLGEWTSDWAVKGSANFPFQKKLIASLQSLPDDLKLKKNIKYKFYEKYYVLKWWNVGKNV